MPSSTGTTLGAICGRRVPVGTEITYHATPGGHLDPVHVEGTERGWWTVPGIWSVTFDGPDEYATSMGWRGPFDVPIGHVIVKPGSPVMGPCPGIIDIVGRRTDRASLEVLGCTTCWTTLKPAVTPLVDVPLFGGEG